MMDAITALRVRELHEKCLDRCTKECDFICDRCEYDWDIEEYADATEFVFEYFKNAYYDDDLR